MSIKVIGDKDGVLTLVIGLDRQNVNQMLAGHPFVWDWPKVGGSHQIVILCKPTLTEIAADLAKAGMPLPPDYAERIVAQESVKTQSAEDESAAIEAEARELCARAGFDLRDEANTINAEHMSRQLNVFTAATAFIIFSHAASRKHAIAGAEIAAKLVKRYIRQLVAFTDSEAKKPAETKH